MKASRVISLVTRYDRAREEFKKKMSSKSWQQLDKLIPAMYRVSKQKRNPFPVYHMLSVYIM